ncbi:MAG: ammonium transporter, partial [Aureliella sp.]
MLHVSFRVLLIALGITLGGAFSSLTQAQEASSPAAESATAPAETPAPAAPAESSAAEPLTLEQRLAVVEAYLANGDAKATLSDSQKAAFSYLPGPGHNSWIMVCSALVLFMTLPGLALFYGGLVREKNVLSVVAQCFGCAGLVTILWVTVGYTSVFGEGGSPYWGNMLHVMFEGVSSVPDSNYSSWVSENVFAMFQLMFAIITPALIVGAIAERMKYSAIMLFIALWMFVVYFPLAHMVWSVDGLMNGAWNGAAKIRSI